MTLPGLVAELRRRARHRHPHRACRRRDDPRPPRPRPRPRRRPGPVVGAARHHRRPAPPGPRRAGHGVALGHRPVRPLRPPVGAAGRRRRGPARSARRTSARSSTRSPTTSATPTPPRTPPSSRRRWGRLGLPPGWLSRRDLGRARAMTDRLATYVREADAAGWRRAASEESMRVALGRAVVTGRVDRVEVDAHGRVRVVDLKTGASKPSAGEVARHGAARRLPARRRGRRPRRARHRLRRCGPPPARPGRRHDARRSRRSRRSPRTPSPTGRPTSSRAPPTRWARPPSRRPRLAGAGPASSRSSCPAREEGRRL